MLVQTTKLKDCVIIEPSVFGDNRGFFLETFSRHRYFEEAGIELEFRGEGVNEIATVKSIEGNNAPALSVGDVIVKVDPRYFRPAEVETLLGDPSKAKAKLGWVPQITVEKMCAEMVANDLDKAKQHAILKEHGYTNSVAVE